LQLPKDLHLTVYDYAAMPTRSPIPPPTDICMKCSTLHVVYYDTVDTNLLQTCKLVRDEAQTMFDCTRNAAPVLAFSLKNAELLCTSVEYTGQLLWALLQITSSSMIGQVNLDPLLDFSSYVTCYTPRDRHEYTKDLRPIYIKSLCGIPKGRRVQIRVILDDGLFPPGVGFWNYFCAELGYMFSSWGHLWKRSRSGLELVFVTPPGMLTACRKQISELQQSFAGVPTDMWSVEEVGAILAPTRD
jgi:hypothetical protein